MNLAQLLLVLRERYKVALGVGLLVILAGLLASWMVTKQYVAETSVLVDVKQPDPISAVLLPGNLSTEVEIIKSDRVTRKVIKALRLDESPAVTKGWLEATGGKGKLENWVIGLLQKSVTVSPSRDSNVISISYRGVDPEFVAAAANAFAQAYIEASVELKVEPARQYARWFGDQAKVLRENVEKAQTRLSEFQQKNNIVATDEAMDFELARLNDLSARLTAAQGETRDVRSKQRSGSGETLQDPVVQGLRGDVAKREVALKEAAGNLGTKHPQYQRMELELAELKIRLEAETQRVLSGYTASGAVGMAKESELRDAMEAQKRKLLDLKRRRDEIAVLVRDVDTAKRAYEAVTNRYTQTSLESQATNANVSVLSPAIVPLEPSFPKSPGKTLLMVLGLGVLFAGAAAAGLEMLDRRIRSADDLAEMLQVPVLAVIEGSKPAGLLALPSRAIALLSK